MQVLPVEVTAHNATQPIFDVESDASHSWNVLYKKDVLTGNK
jgi:hypothetical protein